MQWNRLQTSVPFHQGLHTFTSLPVFLHGRKCSLWVSGEGCLVILLHSGELPSNLFIPSVLVCWGAWGALELHWVSPRWLFYSRDSPSPCPLFPSPPPLSVGPLPLRLQCWGRERGGGVAVPFPPWINSWEPHFLFIKIRKSTAVPMVKKIHVSCSCRPLDFSVVSSYCEITPIHCFSYCGLPFINTPLFRTATREERMINTHQASWI